MTLNYSSKNIAISNQKEYKLKLIEQIRKFCRRVRLKVHFSTENDDTYISSTTQNYGFKSRWLPKLNNDLKKFEEEMFELVKIIKFRKIKDKFQEQLRNDLKEINKSKHVIVKADKTNNYYKVEKSEYTKLLMKNIRKNYKKGEQKFIDQINEEAQTIAKSLKLDDRINQLPIKQCYITLKDHKDDFNIKPETRLINPTSSEIGKISKLILERINKIIREKKTICQWTSTEDVILWFTKLEKDRYKLMKFDIEQFYPSIDEELLLKALNFASTYTKITEEDKKIILNAAKSILFNQGEVWIKSKNKNSNPLYDITMGSKHGAEVCEIVGLYIMSKLKEKTKLEKIGIYRDDGLIAIDKKTSGTEIEKIKKELYSFSKEIGIKFKIENPAFEINFLDLNLNAYSNTFYPYRKPNNEINYINSKSNHPKSIINAIPAMIEKRINKHSSNKSLFDQAKNDYNNALKKSGYHQEIKYTELNTENQNKRKKNRNRKCIWFNPPFCKSVKTNIGRKFINLIDKHFNRNSNLRKIINKNNIRISYCCMQNMENAIKSHNAKILEKPNRAKDKTKACNCRKKTECPLKGKECRRENVIYEAKIKTNNQTKSYIGLSSNEIKKRIATHKTTMNCKPGDKNYNKYVNATELSKLVHKLKDQNQPYEIQWTIKSALKEQKAGKETCKLCLTEALIILDQDCINKRTELMGSCRHQAKFLLKNWKKLKTRNTY